MLTHENKDRTNLRIFEVTASGGLLLTERNEFISKYLAEGEEVLMYSSAEEVNRIFSQSLNYDCIALAGMKRIVDGGNSFEDRVSVLLNAIACE
jgi:spore maturation protein CgeB